MISYEINNLKVKFNCTYTMSLDEKSGEVKCEIQRKNKQNQKQKKHVLQMWFFFKVGHKTFVMTLTLPCSFLLVCDDKSIWQSHHRVS